MRCLLTFISIPAIHGMLPWWQDGRYAHLSLLVNVAKVTRRPLCPSISPGECCHSDKMAVVPIYLSWWMLPWWQDGCYTHLSFLVNVAMVTIWLWLYPSIIPGECCHGDKMAAIAIYLSWWMYVLCCSHWTVSVITVCPPLSIIIIITQHHLSNIPHHILVQLQSEIMALATTTMLIICTAWYYH